MKILFDKINVCDEALSVVESFINDGKDNEAISLLKDISLLVESIKFSLDEDLSGHVFVEKASTICSNLAHSMKRFLEHPRISKRIFMCEIKLLFWQLKFCVDWKYKYLSSNESLRDYREKLADSLREKLNKKNNKNYKYKVSIVVTAYNKLEYTKLAIESIYKYTDFSKGTVELITLNNGSADGTEEYFDSLPNEKKINLKHNLIGMPGIEFVCEGEFIVGFSNDVVATPRWLEQLLACIESSTDIAMVVPTCNEDSISLFQGIPIPYKNEITGVDEIEKFASTYNHSDANLWENRIALMPFVGIYRSDLRNPPFLDPSYTKLQFIDDDYSTLFRRTGWRMVLAKDTFLHHFGSITLSDQKISSNHNAMTEMRKVYFDKWGVDAWNSRGLLNVANVLSLLTPKKQVRILWIEPKFGMDFLTVKNHYRRNHCESIRADAIVLDSRYQPDAKYYFDQIMTAGNLSQALSELNEKYDIIGMGAYFHEILDCAAIDMLERAYGLLSPGGQLIVPMKNFSSASSLKELIVSGEISQWEHSIKTFKGLSLGGLIKELSKNELSKVCSRFIVYESDQTLYEKMSCALSRIFSDYYSSSEFEVLMKVSKMCFMFNKPDVS